MSAPFLRGVRRHQVIDAFTDTHPVVHRSRARIGGDYRRVSGILVDVLYDHFLAIDWDRYASESLEAFTVSVYTEIRACAIALPEPAQSEVERMIREDRLASYRRIEGIEASLRRVSACLSARVGQDFELENAVSELLANFDGLKADFAEFFPALQAACRRSHECLTKSDIAEESWTSIPALHERESGPGVTQRHGTNGLRGNTRSIISTRKSGRLRSGSRADSFR